MEAEKIMDPISQGKMTRKENEKGAMDLRGGREHGGYKKVDQMTVVLLIVFVIVHTVSIKARKMAFCSQSPKRWHLNSAIVS